jgi:flagellar hook-associated protein 3 FlgL
MRVSEQQRYAIATERMEEAKRNNLEALDHLSSNRRINRLSDDPIGVANAIKGKHRITQMDQFTKNIDYSTGYLTTAESAVTSIVDALTRARELAVAMSNDTYDDSSRLATSKEVRELKDQLISLGNAEFNGRFVFGGFRTNAPAVGLGGEFLGDDGAIFVPVSMGQFKQINVQARALFEATTEERQLGHFNMITAVDTFLQGLEGNDKSAIHRAMDELDHQLDKASNYQASLGALTTGLEKTKGNLASQIIDLREGVSKIEDVDVYQATSDFKKTESILQSTLMSANKLLQPSLLNFLQ